MADKCGTCKQNLDICTCAVEKKGAKFDGDKLRWDLLPIEEVEQIVEVLTDGAKKYADNNWMRVPEGKERYFAAMMRHITSYRKGELIDKDSGRTHLAHAACCLIFLMWFDNSKKRN